MLGTAPRCCAHLAGVSGGEFFYLGSSIIIKFYSTFSTAIGGRDGMDGGRTYWMMFPFWETFQIRQILMDLVDF